MRTHGPNELRASRPVSAWKILGAQLRSVVVLLLLAAASISLLSRDWLDAGAIIAVLVINTALGFTTDFRARRAMQALLGLETPRAVVVRDGHAREIDAREVVPGDVLRIEAGQSIAADSRILEAADLRTDEATLTGESLPVQKGTEPLAAETLLPDRSNMLYKGTTAVAGAARALVVATGMDTELGRIGQLVSGIGEERTPLEHRLDALGRRLVWVALFIGAAVVALGWAHGTAVSALIQTGIALTIAAVPESLPAVSTIALAVGVRRMARRQALVRRLPSVETLGSVTTICTDKTGTLTSGEMTATVLWVGEREIAVSGVGYAPDGALTEDGRQIDAASDAAIDEALRIAVLANRAGIVRRDGEWKAQGDPTEAALLTLAGKAGMERDRTVAEYPEIGEIPFSSERMLMATFHRPVAGEGRTVAYVKGAPARVVERCTRIRTTQGERPLDDAAREELLERNRALAKRGLRVLALARGSSATEELRDLTFAGYVGMIDPPAAGVRETIETFDRAGIRTIMLTGDQQLTAEAIARDLGILHPGDEVIDGRALAGLSADEVGERAGRLAAFSRVSPAQKLEIISGLQSAGQVVAMLGDGVNDAAALKKADVGVAMGKRGTDVAKEAASVVLEDDRFTTIAAAIEEGRVIFDNIRKFVFYLFSCNLAEIMVLLGAGALGMPLPLLPLQILWLNLATDTFPALALALEPPEPNVMRRPPRDPQEAILSRAFLLRVTAFAGLIAVPTLAVFAFAQSDGGPAGESARANTMAFMTLALAQVFHLANARQREHVFSAQRAFANRYAIGAVGLVLVLQAATIFVPPLARVLKTAPLSAADWLIVGVAGAIPALVGQVGKLVVARRHAAAGA